MKFIKKRKQEPLCIKSWKKANKDLTVNKDYNSMNCHENLRQILLSEQGFLCAYTMRKIDKVSCHIEHIIPQTQCKWTYSTHGAQYAEDTSYHNILACYPKTGQNCEYGAVRKGSTPIQVSPLTPSCESQFKFKIDGRVEGVSDAAVSTIEVLRLNDNELIELRKSEISGRGLSKSSRRRLSPRQAARLAKEILSKSVKGEYSQFCVAVHQVASNYANKVRDS